jgi:predicted aconitase with swiveling domain
MVSSLHRKKTEFYVGLSLLALLSLCFGVSAACGGMGTYAWFVHSRETQDDLSNIVSDTMDIVSSIKVFPYHALTSTEGTASTDVFTYEKTAETGKTMGKYSILKPDGHSVLIEVDLTDYGKTLANMNLVAVSQASSYLGEIDSTTGTLKQPLKLTGNSLSSIVCFYAFDAASITDSGTYYSVSLPATKNAGGSKMTFVNNDAIVPTQNICSFASAISSFYIILDYDVTLIEDVYSANIGNEVISDTTYMEADGQSYLSFVGDFYFSIYPTGA